MSETATRELSDANKSQSDPGLSKARESFSGRLLTEPQFDEVIAITRIIEREIYRSGTFKDKLQDYAYAMARSENMDARKLEGTIRDLFKERIGQTMNQLRENLKAREETPPEDLQNKALLHAHEIKMRMAGGEKIAFHRSVAEEAQSLADELGVTDNHAKKLMVDAFAIQQGDEGLSWKEWGAQLDETYYRPQIDAEKDAREAAKQKTKDKIQQKKPARALQRRR